MKTYLLYLILLIFISLSSCRNERMVIYCDPYLEEFCNEFLQIHAADFPPGSYELVVHSSELIEQHILYGQPMDLYLSTNGNLAKQEVKDLTIEQFAFASDKIAYVLCIKHEMATKLESANCNLLAASESPVRRYTDEMLHDHSIDLEESCLLYANFHGIMREYLEGGWVRGGWTFSSFAGTLSNVEVVQEGPVLKNVHQAYHLKSGRNSALSGKFIGFLADENTKELLGRLHFIL